MRARLVEGGVKKRVLKTLSITHDYLGGEASTIELSLSERVAGYLPVGFVVAIEMAVDNGAFFEIRNGRMFVMEDDTDAASADKTVRYVGMLYPSWLMQKCEVRPGGTVIENERRWTGESPGLILGDLWDEARARGWGPLLTRTWTDTHDSNGVPWPAGDDLSIGIPLYSKFGDVLQSLTNQGVVDWWTEGMELKLCVAGTGTDRSSTISLGPRADRRPFKSNIGDIFTHLSVLPEGLPHYELPNPATTTEHGRLEQSQTQSGVSIPATSERLAQKALLDGRAQKQEVSLEFGAANAPKLPHVDYFVGDILRARTRATWENLRLVAITTRRDEKGVISFTPTLSYRRKSLTARLAGRASASSAGGLTGGATSIPLPSASPLLDPNPKAPGTPSVTSNVGEFDADGVPRSRVTITWPAVTQAIDDSLIDVELYELWLGESGDILVNTLSTTATSATLVLDPDVLMAAEIRARSASGLWSEFSVPVTFTPARDTTPLTAPSTPVLSSKLGSVTVAWDGDLAVGPMPERFRYAYAATSSTSGGAYTPRGSTFAENGTTLAGLTVGSTVWVRIYAVDSNGIVSPGSTPVSVVVQGVGAGEINVDAVTMDSLDATVTGAIDDALQAGTDAQADADAAAASALAAQNAANAAQAEADQALADARAYGWVEAMSDVSGWTRVAGSRALASFATSEALVGGAVARSTGTGDTRWTNTARRIPIDPDVLYKVTVRYRKLTSPVGAGHVYFGLSMLDASEQYVLLNGTSPTPPASNSMWLVSNVQPPGDGSWVTGVYYVKGRAAGAGTTAGSADPTVGAKFPGVARYFEPSFITGISGDGIGTFDVDVFSVEVVSSDKADALAAAAQSAAATAQSAADDAAAAASAAQGTASTALTTANGKNAVWRQNDPPAGTAHSVDDVWFDTNDGNRIYLWSGSAWTAAQFGTNAIANAAITNALIANLDAGKINTGTLDALRIAAESISTSKLLVASLTNLLEDPSFSSTNTAAAWSLAGGAVRTTVNLRSGPGALVFTVGAAAYECAKQVTAIAVQPGEQYLYGAWIRTLSGTDVENAVELSVAYGATAAATTSFAAVVDTPTMPSATFVYMSGVWTVPAGTYWARPRIVVRATTGGRSYVIDDLVFAKRMGGELIVDGSITTPKLAVGSVVAEILAANSVTTNALQAGSVTTEVLAADAVTANELAANSVTANAIVAGIIEAYHLAASVGQSLDISSNTSINLLVGDIATANSAIEGVASTVEEMGTYYRFGADEATITSPSSTYELALSPSGIEIRENGVAVSRWDAGQMIVSSMVVESIVLANHQIEAYGTGSVVRKL